MAIGLSVGCKKGIDRTERGGTMRIKHIELIRLSFTILKARVAVLAGFFVLLPGIHLRGQDQLLKEYIYLDGRLLVMERQSTPAIAQQPAIGEDKDVKAEAAADWLPDGNALFPPVNARNVSLSNSREPLVGSVALRQRLGWPAFSPASVSGNRPIQGRIR
jgi:hypothetical protein